MPYPWYVIHCEAHHDRQVQHSVSLSNIEVYAPRIPATRKRNGDKPLFPGYVFARLDLASGVWGRLRYLPGVRSLVTNGAEPSTLDDGIVEAIRQRVDDFEPQVTRLKLGDRVRVLNGTFSDLEGLFCESLTGEQRIAVLIDMMRRQVRVEIDVDDVVPVHRVEVESPKGPANQPRWPGMRTAYTAERGSGRTRAKRAGLIDVGGRQG